jgi:nucleoid DNA-binding protein/nucleoid-associated protein YgaU
MEKLNLQEFVGQIAQQTRWTKKESDEVLKAFLATITEGLETDEQVKVKGFGTFKRVWNEPRQSVKIKSGEKFEIAGHYKVSFTPEAELKELINTPYAHLATTYLEDGEDIKREPESRLDLSKLSSEALGLKAIIDEIKSQNKETTVKEEVAIVEPRVEVVQQEEAEEKPQEELPEQEVEEAIEEAVVEETVEDEPEEKTGTMAAAASTEPTVAEMAAIVAEVSQEENPEPKQETVEKKKKRRCCATCCWILGAIVLLALLYYFLFAPFKINFDVAVEENEPRFEWSSLIPGMNEDTPEFSEIDSEITIVDVPDTLLVDSIINYIETDSLFSQTDDFSENQDLEEIAPMDSVSIEEPMYIDTVVLKSGDSLMKFAYKYYGHTSFWVYIYEANREKIPAPNKVHIGTKLNIPAIDEVFLDLKNPENEARVAEMKREILKNNE